MKALVARLALAAILAAAFLLITPLWTDEVNADWCPPEYISCGENGGSGGGGDDGWGGGGGGGGADGSCKRKAQMICNIGGDDHKGYCRVVGGLCG